MDWWPAIKGCVVLSNGSDAISIFEQTDDRVWQGHILFDKSHRGKEAIKTARAMIAWMMPKHADAIWGAVPMRNRAARLFMRRIGMSHFAFEDYGGAMGDVEIFVLKDA